MFFSQKIALLARVSVLVNLVKRSLSNLLAQPVLIMMVTAKILFKNATELRRKVSDSLVTPEMITIMVVEFANKMVRLYQLDVKIAKSSIRDIAKEGK